MTHADGKVMMFAVDTVMKNGAHYFPVQGDSIWIDAAAGIVDLPANKQNRYSKPIPLKVGKYDYSFALIAFPNPYMQGEAMNEKSIAWSNYGIPGTPAVDDIAL